MGKKSSKAKPVTVGKIVTDYLKKNGFDGLFNEAEDCGCVFTSAYGDTHCSGPDKDCRPGYAHSVTKKGKDIRAEKPKTS